MMAKVFCAVACMLALSETLDARGYYGNLSRESSSKNKDKSFQNEVTKLSPDENSVENSKHLLHDQEKDLESLDPILTNLADVDVNSQILVQLKEMNDQIVGLRRSMSNLKYQSHLQYKMMKRMQGSCDAGVVVGEPQQHMIRTAALTLDRPSSNSAPPATTCPDGFEYNPETRSCYLFGSDRITWRMAREKCLIMGADLVSIETNREQRYITDTARARSDIRHCDFWTGLTDAGSEGHWYWINNKKALSYAYWNHNEPNNGNGDEHCMHMLWVFGWSWNDARCNYDSACYVCEIHKGKDQGRKGRD